MFPPTDSISAEDHITVPASVGSTALLPCSLNNDFTETPVFRWLADGEVVFEQSSDGQRYEGPGYEGRVDVPDKELRIGDCSLLLKNVRLADDGIYVTFVVERADRANAWKEISKVELSVNGKQYHTV